jgi:hypothetical protein
MWRGSRNARVYFESGPADGLTAIAEALICGDVGTVPTHIRRLTCPLGRARPALNWRIVNLIIWLIAGFEAPVLSLTPMGWRASLCDLLRKHHSVPRLHDGKANQGKSRLEL